MYWANFLHLYQPPTQSEEVTRKVTAEAYRTLVRVLRAAPSARTTINVSGCLTQQLARWDGDDVIAGLRELAEAGQVEFTGSAMFHPVLPLIPPDEMERQIALNEETNRRYFGPAYAPRGFFPPEMCYSAEVGEIVRRMGYEWVIMDEAGHRGRFGTVRHDTLYQDPRSGLTVFFRDRPVSASLTYGKFPGAAELLDTLGPLARASGYLLTGTDGEIYGHHRPGQERLLEEMYRSEELPPVTISELFDLIARRETVEPLPSAWSTWEDEFAAGAPFAKWYFPGNTIQERQWELTDVTIDLVNQAQDAAGYTAARAALDAALHSCQYWWASCRPWWDTGMIARGVDLFSQALCLVADAHPDRDVRRALRLAESINTLARAWQESGEARERSEEYQRTHPFPFASLAFHRPA